MEYITFQSRPRPSVHLGGLHEGAGSVNHLPPRLASRPLLEPEHLVPVQPGRGHHRAVPGAARERPLGSCCRQFGAAPRVAALAGAKSVLPDRTAPQFEQRPVRRKGRTPDFRAALPPAKTWPSPDTASVDASKNQGGEGHGNGRHERPHCSLALSIYSFISSWDVGGDVRVFGPVFCVRGSRS